MHFGTGVDRLIAKLAIWILLALAAFLLRLVYRWLLARVAKWWQNRRSRTDTKPQSRPPEAKIKAGQAILKGLSGQYAGMVIPLHDGPVFLGRDPKANRLVFSPETAEISLRHCMVKYERGGFWLQDLVSSNGTYVQPGLPVAPGQLLALNPGDRFYLGDPIHLFEVGYA